MSENSQLIEIQSIHHQAMGLAESAFIQYERNNLSEAAKSVYKSAFLLEKSIADKIKHLNDCNAMRCIILQSVLHLSLAAGIPEDAVEYAADLAHLTKYLHLRVEAETFIDKYVS